MHQSSENSPTPHSGRMDNLRSKQTAGLDRSCGKNQIPLVREESWNKSSTRLKMEKSTKVVPLNRADRENGFRFFSNFLTFNRWFKNFSATFLLSTVFIFSETFLLFTAGFQIFQQLFNFQPLENSFS